MFKIRLISNEYISLRISTLGHSNSIEVRDYVSNSIGDTIQFIIKDDKIITKKKAIVVILDNPSNKVLIETSVRLKELSVKCDIGTDNPMVSISINIPESKDTLEEIAFDGKLKTDSFTLEGYPNLKTVYFNTFDHTFERKFANCPNLEGAYVNSHYEQGVNYNYVAENCSNLKCFTVDFVSSISSIKNGFTNCDKLDKIRGHLDELIISMTRGSGLPIPSVLNKQTLNRLIAMDID